MKNYVIIGNSTAAINCVEAIRTADKAGKITVISDETHHTYGRPLISYLLCGRTDLQRMKYRPDDWYEVNNAEKKFGVKAVRISPDEKFVLLNTGEKIPYDKLLVATGSRPFIPPMPGLDEIEEKYFFMTLDDALAMERDFDKTDDVLIVGAGLIGLKCLEGILDRVKSVSVVDMANRVLPSILDETGSAIVQKSLEARGVKFFLSDSAAQFKERTAVLKSGKEVRFTKLVLAVGVRPNIELVKEAGGVCDRGIRTDNTQLTSLSDVYAAGDCTTSHDIAADTDRILALLPNAAYQGKTAGLNMAGEKSVFDNAVPMNAMGLFELHMITAGVYEGESYEEREGDNYKKLFYKDNLLKGFILIGNIERAGIYTSLLRNKTPLDGVNFEQLKKSPALAAFSTEYRREKLTKKV